MKTRPLLPVEVPAGRVAVLWALLAEVAPFAVGVVPLTYKAAVRGLVFAAGNAIENTGGVAPVKGTLVCDTNGSASADDSILVDTPHVDLDEEGDAHFSDSSRCGRCVQRSRTSHS